MFCDSILSSISYVLTWTLRKYFGSSHGGVHPTQRQSIEFNLREGFRFSIRTECWKAYKSMWKYFYRLSVLPGIHRTQQFQEQFLTNFQNILQSYNVVYINWGNQLGSRNPKRLTLFDFRLIDVGNAVAIDCDMASKCSSEWLLTIHAYTPYHQPHFSYFDANTNRFGRYMVCLISINPLISMRQKGFATDMKRAHSLCTELQLTRLTRQTSGYWQESFTCQFHQHHEKVTNHPCW